MKQIPDEADVLAENETLKTTLAKAEADLKAAHDLLAAAQADLKAAQDSRDAIQGQLKAAQERATQLDGQLQNLNARVGALEKDNQTLQAELNDFNGRLARELAKRGIRDQAAPHTQATDRKLTATEKVLAAKGVSSLEELSGK